MRMTPLSILTGVAGVVALCSLANLPASAMPQYINDWSEMYPGSLTADNLNAGGGSYCQVCHAEPSGGNPWNGYGWSVRQAYNNNGGDLLAAFVSVENLNADMDPTGCSNVAEINADTQPGWTEGLNNTFYYANLSRLENQPPPVGVLGDFDPLTPCCQADLDGDGSVGIVDFLALLAAWGPCPAPPQLCPADLDDDNEVGITDFLQLLADWGPCS